MATATVTSTVTMFITTPVHWDRHRGARISPMFLDFFGLREQPFGVTPDPRYLYLGPGHREALASSLLRDRGEPRLSLLDCETGDGQDHAAVSPAREI